jgi:hypothetical protein
LRFANNGIAANNRSNMAQITPGSVAKFGICSATDQARSELPAAKIGKLQHERAFAHQDNRGDLAAP